MTNFDDSIFELGSVINAHRQKQRRGKICDKMGCDEDGLYKAPRSPQNLREYYHFCLEHIRQYNKSWDFFDGCSDDFLQDYLLKDITGHRPTWPMGNIPGTKKDHLKRASDYFKASFSDPFDIGDTIFGDAKNEKTSQDKKVRSKSDIRNEEVYDACHLLGITYPPKFAEARKSYKSNVKKYHPDVNQNEPQKAEEMLRHIVKAYQSIKDFCNE